MYNFFGGNKEDDSGKRLIDDDHAPSSFARKLQAFPDEKHEGNDMLDPHGVHYSHHQKFDDGSTGAPFLTSYFTLANTIMGSGLLGLPYAFSRTGWVLGTLLIMASAISSAFALHELTCCALKMPYPSSFYKVASAAFPGLEKLIDVAVVIKCFGVAVSYLIVIGDLMPDVIGDMGGTGFWESRFLWVTIGFIIVIPLSFFKNLSALKYMHIMAVGCVLLLVVLVVSFSADVDSLDPCATDDDADDVVCVGEKANFIFDMESMKSLSIFIFGFTCHQNMFTIVNEIGEPVTKTRLDRVVVAAIGTAFILYMIVATTGYKTFGDQVESNILISYPNAPFVTVARIFVFLLVCFSYPLQINPSRSCLMTLLASIFKDDEKPQDGSLDRVLTLRYFIITSVFLGLSYAIALSVEDLGVMLSLVGATGSTLVSFILPGFCYYLLFKDEGPVWKRNMALLQGCVGLCIIPICLTFIFL